MIIFVYTFALIFIALVLIAGFASFLKGSDEKDLIPEGQATAAMCTTQLLGRGVSSGSSCDEDFVIEQDMVFTYDSINIF